MAYTLTWSPVARDDLRALVSFIALDNPERASSFGLALIQKVELLQDFPEMGRVVPEWREPKLREIVVRPYRIIYRVSPERELLEIVRVWHAARGEPERV